MAKRSRTRTNFDNRIATKAVSTQRTLPQFKSEWLWALLLILAVILTYLPTWQAGFIWDDDTNITGNPCIIGPLGLKEVWTTSAAKICPLVLTTFWVEHALWGLDPLPYHVVNVLMHAACAVVLWRVLLMLRVPGAWLGAALWALHPIQVESVAWVTEMKNTQSGLFFLLSVLFFVKSLQSDGSKSSFWNYALTLLFAAMALASKSSTVILPVVLGLCAWWMEGRWLWRHVVKLAPIFLMAAIPVALSIWTEKLEGGMDPSLVRSWVERLVPAASAVWFYLGKLIWPNPLITIYPNWEVHAGMDLSYVSLAILIIVLIGLWLPQKTWSRALLFALTYFLVALLPVLGFVDHSFLHYGLVADHFQYLASMGPLALAGAGIVRLTVLAKAPWLQPTLGTVLLLTFGVMSWQRTWAYESQETLWTDALAKNPNCWVGYNNLGLALFNKGQLDKAITQYQTAIKNNPSYEEAHNNLGFALIQNGQTNEAISEFLESITINPNNAGAHNNLGNIFLQNEQTDKAIEQYQRTLEIDPGLADVHYNFGNALVKKGELDKAIDQYRETLKIDPNHLKAQYNLSYVLAQKQRMDEKK